MDFFFNDDLVGGERALSKPPEDVDRIERWGGLIFLPLEVPFRVSLYWGDPSNELPLIMGNCNELGGAPFLTIPEHSLVTLRKLFVNRGDMKVMGRPPGVVVSASWSSAFKSSSRLISRSAVCSALATGLACPTDEDMPSSFLTATSVAHIDRLNLGVGSLGDANTSLKLMLMGVSGAPPTARGLCLFFPDFFEASGEMQIMLRWLSGILGVLTPTSPPASNSAKKRSW